MNFNIKRQKVENFNSNVTEEDLLIKNKMEKIVGRYDKYMSRLTLGREKYLREMTVELAQIKKGDRVLEIGCGTGSLTIAAKKQAGPTGNVSGIDILPGMIEISREKAQKTNLEINFQEGSIENIPFADQKFDVVICSFMIFHMSNQVRGKGIEEIYRVLKPSGKLLVLDIALPRKPISRAALKLFLGFMLHHELNELLPVLKSTGFSEIENSPAKFRILGLPILSFLRATK